MFSILYDIIIFFKSRRTNSKIYYTKLVLTTLTHSTIAVVYIFLTPNSFRCLMVAYEMYSKYTLFYIINLNSYFN